jgi:uncharacterized membrane protein YfcA
MTLESLLLIVAGTGAGFLGSMLGIGGGIILVPIMTLALNLPIQTAIAAAIFVVIANSVAISVHKIEQGFVLFRLAGLLEIISLLFGLVGAWLVLYVDAVLLGRIFGGVSLIVAVLMIKDALKKKTKEAAIKPTQDMKIHNTAAVGLLACFAGLMSGLLGVGGGVITVPALTLLARLPVVVAAATSSYVMGVTASGSALLFLTNNQVNYSVTAWCVLGVQLGVFICKRYFNNVNPQVVRWLFAVVLIGIAFKMGLK